MPGEVRKVVADSNVLVKWFIPEDYSREACVLRDDHLYGRVHVIAPAYAALEFANSLRKYVARGMIKESAAFKALDLLRKAEVEFINISLDLVSESLKYSIRKNVTVYDASYIVLARKHNTRVYTADEKLLRNLEGRENCIRHVVDYVKDREEIIRLRQ